MRAILLILILLVVAVIAAVATGLVDIRQTRSAQVPNIEAGDRRIGATGGQTPAFDVETGSIAVGAREQNVTVSVPSVEIRPPNEADSPDAPAPAANSQ